MGAKTMSQNRASPQGVAARIVGAPERGAGAQLAGMRPRRRVGVPHLIARSCPAPGSHPSRKRLEPAPPYAGRFVARLANIGILAAPRFAPSPILARNARAFHRARGSRPGIRRAGKQMEG